MKQEDMNITDKPSEDILIAFCRAIDWEIVDRLHKDIINKSPDVSSSDILYPVFALNKLKGYADKVYAKKLQDEADPSKRRL